MKAWGYNVLLALDLLASAILGGILGETLSGRAGTAYAQGKLRGRIWAPIINAIMFDKMHCANAVTADMARAKAVILDDSRYN